MNQSSVCVWVVCYWDKHLRWLKGTFTCTIRASKRTSPWMKRQRIRTMASAPIIKQLSHSEGPQSHESKAKNYICMLWGTYAGRMWIGCLWESWGDYSPTTMSTYGNVTNEGLWKAYVCVCLYACICECSQKCIHT